MNTYKIINWPECQALMDLEGFDANCKLVLNENTPTYACSTEWLKSHGKG